MPVLRPAEAAIYTAATRFLVVGQLVGQSFSQAVQPMLGAALARQDRAGGDRLYRTATCWLVLIAWPFYLTFAVLGPEILRLFGPVYDDEELDPDELDQIILMPAIVLACGLCLTGFFLLGYKVIH